MACWAADQGYVVLATMPADEVASRIEAGEEVKEKQPLEKWETLEFRSAEEIRASSIFRRRRCAVAILTGKSGLVVVDIDSAAGEAWLKERTRRRRLPRTRILRTPT